MKKLKITILTIVILLVAVSGVVYFYNWWGTKPVNPGDDTPIYVTIEEGSGTAAIAEALDEAGVIRDKTIFRLQSRHQGYDGQYKAGTYELNKTMNVFQIMDKMADGDMYGLTFTVIEGQTIDKVADQLAEEGVIDQKDFYYEVEHGTFDYDFMTLLPEGPTRLEGFLYPNTYTVEPHADAHDVIDAMLGSFDNSMRESGLYDEVAASDKDLYTVITEASIVQREAGKVEEMPRVASVIENRLSINMALQMDSIIAYIQKEDKIRATYSDIAVASDYNPYTNLGLPPGPICAPGADAIRAVLHPEDTNYLYFVASPEMDGTNRYSETYEEFLEDKAAFDAAYEEYIKEHPDAE